MLTDFVSARHFFCTLQQVLGRSQHAGRAEAALQRIALLKGRLQVGDLARVGQTLDGLHLGAVALGGEHQAAAHNLAVNTHSAGTAYAVLAADMASGEKEVVAQIVNQRLARVDAALHAFTVDRQRNIDGVDHPRASINCFATRRSRTPARCFFVFAVACTSSFGSRSSALTAASTSPAASAASAFLARVGVSPTPKKASRTSDSPLPLPRALAARPTIAWSP